MTTAKQPPSKSMTAFFTIWGGQAFSLLGSQLVQFALVWYMTQRTGSATVLALASLVALLPQIFLGPVAGALVDRWNRRVVMMVADSLIALATVILAALFFFDAVQIWHIYLLMFIRSAGGAFHWPAMKASTTLLVPDQHLSRIAGLNEGLWGLASIVSPPLGALLIGLLPMQSILAIDLGTALLAITPLIFITIPNPVRRMAPGMEVVQTSVLTDLRGYEAGFIMLPEAVSGVLCGWSLDKLHQLFSASFRPLVVTRQLHSFRFNPAQETEYFTETRFMH